MIGTLETPSQSECTRIIRMIRGYGRFRDRKRGTPLKANGDPIPPDRQAHPICRCPAGMAARPFPLLRRLRWMTKGIAAEAAEENSPRRQPWVAQFEGQKPRSGERKTPSDHPF